MSFTDGINGWLYRQIQRAMQLFSTQYNPEAFNATNDGDWDDYLYRVDRYAFYEGYYYNTIFDSLQMSQSYRQYKKLYTNTRGLFNPVTRLVEFYRGVIFGGLLDFENAVRGAIPIQTDDEAMQQGIINLWRSSNWQNYKGVFVFGSAMRGDGIIKIAEDKELQTVRMEVLPASEIAHLTFDAVGNVVEAVIAQRREENPHSDFKKTYIYTEVITPDGFATYKDGKPHAFYQNSQGAAVHEWENEYGFVPLVLNTHLDLERVWGTTAFHGITGKVADINDYVSHLVDNAKKVNIPVRLLTGVQNPKATLKLDKSRDGLPFLTAPAGAGVHNLATPIDISGNMTLVNELRDEIMDAIPELQLARVRDGKDAISGKALQELYKDASMRITEARGSYAQALTRAQQMALYIGAYNNYSGFEQLRGREFEDLRHMLAEQPVFEDSLSRSQRITFMRDSGFPVRYIASEMGYPDDEALAIEAEIKEGEAAETAAVINGLIGAQQETQVDNASEEATEPDEEQVAS